jgi:molybdopterin molybdotransferase
MISLAEAQARLLALAAPMKALEVPLAEAMGRWLAAPLIAGRTQPARDLSAMDGYAVRVGDGPGWTVAGESAAGRAFAGQVGADEAVRIFTGAVVPQGADAILIQENVAVEGARIHQMEGDAPKTGDHIRKTGSDFGEGDTLAGAGTQINAATIGLAALAGHATLPVHRRIKVTLISTGDELVRPGEPTREDQIPSSNGVMLSALLAALPVEISDPGIVPDQEATIRSTLADAAGADIIVTLGGASVGDHDLVRPALLAEGAELDFWKIAMRPGKPVMAGRLGDAIVLGLPGNPVSAYVTALLLLMPLIRHLSGAAAPLPEVRQAVLAEALPPNGPRIDHLRGTLDPDGLRTIGVNDSAMLANLSRTTALIVRPPQAPAASAGEIADYIPVN